MLRRRLNNWRAENFVLIMALERYRATTDLAKQIVSRSLVIARTTKNVSRTFWRARRWVMEIKEILAEYVSTGKNIIALST